jgi:predicted nucleic acid-binding protein
MVGIGNLFPFEVTSFSGEIAKRLDRRKPDAKCGPGEPPDKERSRTCRKALDYIQARTQRNRTTGHGSPMSPFLAPMRADAGVSEGEFPCTPVVLDTNAVLDWLVFCDPSCAALSDALQNGRMRWLASNAMREELAHVLARRTFDTWAPRFDAVWSAWDHLARMVEPAGPCRPVAGMRCSDADDQKFIDLALLYGARWLLTRDRAVLGLAGRGRALGLQILTPTQWMAAGGAQCIAPSRTAA